MKQKEIIKELYEKYRNDTISEEEAKKLFSYFNTCTEQERLEVLDDFLYADNYPQDVSYLKMDTPEKFKIVQSKIEKASETTIQKDKILALPQRKSIQKIIAIAASIIIIGAAVVFYFNSNLLNKSKAPFNQVTQDVEPGGNRATLTLADGSTIALSDAQNGIIIGTDSITYSDGSTIFPHVISTEAERSVRQAGNTPERQLALTTPNGGQYQVTLPDGTKAWLNAGTTLTYPSRFSGTDRKVELTGEAYFEVAHNKKQPFIVTSEGQEVTVLGTHFNINAYLDEPNIKTTLIEGSVSVSTLSQTLSSRGTKDPYTPSLTTLLVPNQQAILTAGKLEKITINPEDYISWKDNVFIFHQSNLKSIMKQLSRWYDIEVDISTIPDIEFYGEISRNVKLSQVLAMLEKTSGIKFKIENGKERRITIEK